MFHIPKFLTLRGNKVGVFW